MQYGIIMTTTTQRSHQKVAQWQRLVDTGILAAACLETTCAGETVQPTHAGASQSQ